MKSLRDKIVAALEQTVIDAGLDPVQRYEGCIAAMDDSFNVTAQVYYGFGEGHGIWFTPEAGHFTFKQPRSADIDSDVIRAALEKWRELLKG